MALTQTQIRQMWQSLWIVGEGKAEIKAGNLPLERVKIANVFNAIDNFWESNRVTLKAQMDSAVGVTLTNSEARKIARAWLRFKWNVE